MQGDGAVGPRGCLSTSHPFVRPYEDLLQKEQDRNRNGFLYAKILIVVEFFDFLRTFRVKDIGFPQVLGGLEGLRQVRQAERKNFLQFPSKNIPEGPEL